MPTHEELDWNVSPGPRKKAAGDINSPTYAPRTGTEDRSNKPPVTGTESTTGVEEEAPPAPEVRLLSAEWKPGSKGFQYNEPCFLEVKGEYLTKTIRAKISGYLFGIYGGEEYDLLQEVEGFLEKDTGIAKMELKHLWFIDEHYRVWQEDKNAPCSYKIKNISHSRGENVIESPVLEMPQTPQASIIIRLPIDPNSEEAQDDTFRLYSTDKEKTYDQMLTVKDDKVDGDEFLDLEFTGLNTMLRYTLEIDPGSRGKSYFGFEDKAYRELSNV